MGNITKQSIKGTIVTYLGVAVGFVTTFFVLTRFLSSEDIGLARVLIDAATLFMSLAQLGTSSSIIRFFPYFRDADISANKHHFHGFFFWTLVVPLLGFALFTMVYVACHTPLTHFFGDKSPLFVRYAYFVLPLAFFMLYQTVFETNSNVLMHIVLPRFVKEVVVRVGLLITYLLYAFQWLSIDGFVWTICATYAIAALINGVYLLTLFRTADAASSPTTCAVKGASLAYLVPDWAFLRARRPLVRSYLFYTLFLVVSAVTSVFAPMLSSFFITAQMGLSYTGIFAIATYMAVMVSIPYRSLVSITQPELSEAIKNNDTSNISRLLRQASTNLLLIGGFILLFIWLNIDLIFAILPNGETYAVAREVVLLLGIGQLMVTTFYVFLPALSYSRFYVFSLVNSLVLAVVALLLNNYLIPAYGMLGAAWATVLADIIYYVLVVGVAMAATQSQPFSWAHVWSVVIILAVFALNYLWTTYLTPLGDIVVFSQVGSIHSFVRPLVLLGGSLYLAYRLRISPELTDLIRSKCHLHRS